MVAPSRLAAYSLIASIGASPFFAWGAVTADVVQASARRLSTAKFLKAQKKAWSIESKYYAIGSSSSFPGNGSWACNRDNRSAPKVWTDHGKQREVSEELSADNIISILGSRWLLLVGDSSVRMLYHFMIGILISQWRHWPAPVEGKPGGLSHHGPGHARHYDTCAGNNTLFSDKYPCLEDVLVRGVRFTFAFTDFGAESQLQTLDLLANQSLAAPDAVLLSFGAWSIMYDKEDPEKYASSVDLFTAQLRHFFTTRQHGKYPYFASLRSHPIDWIFASIVGCPAEDEDFQRFNLVARSRATAQGWSWFDRNAVIRNDCTPDVTCQFGNHHPAGAALNVLLKLLLHHIAQSTNTTSGSAQRGTG